MKAINIILSILILLLSAAAAAFSYFLFEKRSQFVTGWAKMARVINESSAALDKGSGTQIAGKLTPSALAHENYANLDSLMKELPQQSRNIITERDALANALQAVSKLTGMDVVSKDKLTNLSTYAPNMNRVVGNVQTVVDKRNATYNNLIAAARSGIKVNIDRKLLLDGDRKAFDSFTQELARVRGRMEYYERSLTAISKKYGSAATIKSFGENAFKEEIAKLEKALDKSLANARQLSRDLDAERRTNRNHVANIAKLNNNIKNLNTVIADRDGQIASFQRAFGLPESRSEAKPWKAGSDEARSALRGKVIAVDTKYGYIAIDFGKYSVVEQKIGNRTIEVNPELAVGIPLVITRKGGEFIARVQIDRVGETSSIANIPLDAKAIQVGDIVAVAVEEKAPAQAPAKAAAKR